jgi:hypothetical protein
VSLRTRLDRLADRMRPKAHTDIEVVLTVLERDAEGNWPDPLPDPRIHVVFEDDDERGGP